MVSGFVLDVMHLCYLGVTKRMLSRMFSPKVKDKSVKLSKHQMDSFHSKLTVFSDFIPLEFSRKMEGGVKTVVKLCFFTILSMYISWETSVYNAIPCQ